LEGVLPVGRGQGLDRRRPSGGAGHVLRNRSLPAKTSTLLTSPLTAKAQPITSLASAGAPASLSVYPLTAACNLGVFQRQRQAGRRLLRRRVDPEPGVQLGLQEGHLRPDAGLPA